MTEDAHRIEPVTAATVEAWLAFMGDAGSGRHREVLASLGRWPRFLVRRGEAVDAGLVLERSVAGMTIFPPRLAAGLPVDRRAAALAAIGRFVAPYAAGEGAHFLECMMMVRPDDDGAWRRALLANGFVRLSTKSGWSVAVPADPPGAAGGPFTVEGIGPGHAAAEAAFAATLEASLDPTSVFEGRYGVGPGGFDFAYLACREDVPVGLCTCLVAADGGWIKYIGVAPAARGQGLAGRLACAAFAGFRGRGVATVRVLIDVANAPSIALHRRLGFAIGPASGEIYYRAL